jgi:hypothetical protein
MTPMPTSIPQNNVYEEIRDLVEELTTEEGMSFHDAYERAQSLVLELAAYANQWDANRHHMQPNATMVHAA